MQSEQLVDMLKTRQHYVDPQWVAGLSERKRKECEFHNHSRDTRVNDEGIDDHTYQKLHGNKKFYSTVSISREYIKNWVAEKVKGKVFLDYACGDGSQTIQGAQLGAAISIGIDISDVSIQQSRSNALQAGVSDKCVFIQGDCENTGLPDESVDVIMCSGMLHHLELSYAYPEMRRILKKGGCVLAVEALAYNPLINWYRRRTPEMRTDWEKEHILSVKDVKFASRFFRVGQVKFWHFFSLIGAYFKGLLPFLNKLDAVFLKIPIFRLMAWQFTFELYKKDDE